MLSKSVNFATNKSEKRIYNYDLEPLDGSRMSGCSGY